MLRLLASLPLLGQLGGMGEGEDAVWETMVTTVLSL
jgi:hypothetical protein